MKTPILIAAFSALCVGCTTPSHIRKSNYYRYDWGLSGMVTGHAPEAYKYHPVFAEIEEISLEGPPSYEAQAHYFLFGLVPTKKEIKLSEACGKQPFRQAYADHGFWQATVSLFTLGIYTPRTIRVWCGNETASK